MKLTHTTAAVAVALLTSAVGAESVRVTVHGQVESRVPGVGLFASVNTGDDASMSFTVDTSVFEDGSNALTRAPSGARRGIAWPGRSERTAAVETC